MRNLLLIILAVCILLSAVLGGRVLVIQLEVPSDLLPYYEWLLSFPGLHQPANNLIPEQQDPYPSRSL